MKSKITEVFDDCFNRLHDVRGNWDISSLKQSEIQRCITETAHKFGVDNVIEYEEWNETHLSKNIKDYFREYLLEIASTLD